MEKPISEMTTNEMAAEYVKERMARYQKSESNKLKSMRLSSDLILDKK